MRDYSNVLNEITTWLDNVNRRDFDYFVEVLSKYKKVVGYGAGRMGLSLRAFLMRLNHLGYQAYYYTDNYIPPLDEDTLFIASTGSGNTKTVVQLIEIAKSRGAKIGIVTGDAESKAGKLADYLLTYIPCNGGLNAPDDPHKITSIQPMSTLNEQGTYILFDLIILELINKKNIKLEDTKKYHSNLE